MATVCTNCGQELPRGDAHFCNHCGTLVPSHPFSAQSLAANAAAKAVEPEKHVLREQRVQQPPAKPPVQESQSQQPPRTTRRIAPDDANVGSNLTSTSGPQRTTRRIGPDNLSQSAVAWPAPLTHVSVREPLVQNNVARVEPQRSQPIQNAAVRTTSVPPQEAPVKIEENKRNNPPTPLPELRKDERQDIEETPTTPLETASSQHVEDVPTLLQPAVSGSDNVEHLDTVPVPNYPQKHTSVVTQQAVTSPRSLSGNTNSPVEQRVREQQVQPYVAHTPLPASRPATSAPSQQVSGNGVQNQSRQLSSVQDVRSAPTATPLPATATRRQKSRVPFIILLACFCILILGGGAWIALANPFAVPAITQPLQSFKNTQLGVSLSYPSGWTAQKNAAGVVLSDSSHTATAKLSAATTGSDAAAYLQQQATKSGMTAIKTLGTASFGGATWQQVQGNIQQDGVNYTMYMFATLHGNQMYVLTQMAPQNVYADEESVVFSAIRNSFAFL